MSAKHPIIAITGSSGAGTTSVTRTFENIFRREGVKAAIIEGVKLAAQQPTEEQIQQRIKDAVAAAGLDLKQQELALKYPAGANEAQDALIRAQAVEVGVKAAFAAIQTAGAIVQTPQISPVADMVMKLAGWLAPKGTRAMPRIEGEK